MKTIIIVILLLFCVAGCISCSKFLDKKSDTSIDIPNSLRVLQALLDNSDVFNISVTPAFGEASADDYFIEEKTLKTMEDRLSSVYSWRSLPYKFSNNWSVCYTSVYYSNLCLESVVRIEKNETNKDQWNYIKGAALFHRAYAFLNLAWTFAKAYDASSAATDLGIDLRVQSDFKISSKRSSVQETYDRIIADAKEALGYLPDTSNHVFRPSKAAASGLLARAYLSMRNYDSAFRYADQCLTIKNDLLDYNTIGDNDNPFLNAGYSGETVFYTTMSLWGRELFDKTYKRAMADTLLYARYDENDLRKKLFFNAGKPYSEFKGMYGVGVARYFSGIATDEIYLIRAECNARLARLQAALKDLNDLLKKRWNKNVPYKELAQNDAAAVLELILLERRKELLMRGLRWADIKRLNKEGAHIVPARFVNGALITLPANDPAYALPLPDDIINLTGMQQN
ncbi:RagB/SusD family nutrient uptake outer membrane protein [Niabella pedocola]|uniref:RagB/SusD family nutrient uptake outer membrane protein n=1 Tax=Niabella pedocola TaxID=1752077 RepID=A0ABS8PXZ0_9BACT|nr:RagB/SusD family nutrient uptake outer membrane protein [Niabella pedocola]MCD2425915.1 RagB/SusD family nutrient uptake outer membrane protein [Niabella pedocola]